jgi:hypothetical protein
MAIKLTDDELRELIEEVGPAEAARRTGLTIRGVYRRRANIELRTGRQITAPIHGTSTRATRFHINHPERHHLDINNGTIIVGSDAHYWPGEATTAHKGMVKFVKDLKPYAVIMNGDIFDGARVSRHPSIGWEDKPSVIQEIEVCQERLGEIQDAHPKAKHIWPLGNHDGRFESRLANVAPEYARVNGLHLRDHFPHWEPCWSCWVNNDVVVKHRYKGGVHAAHNNIVASGKSMVTGHLHSGKVTPYSDYNGIRWGVDLPTMADPYGPQFVDYTEDNSRNHRSGFAILTFYKGVLLCPEIVFVYDGEEVQFRGSVINV